MIASEILKQSEASLVELLNDRFGADDNKVELDWSDVVGDRTIIWLRAIKRINGRDAVALEVRRLSDGGLVKQRTSWADEAWK